MAQQDAEATTEGEDGQCGEDSLVGKTIVDVRKMTHKEMEREGWPEDNLNGRPTAIVLSDGSVLYPSRDPEGNGAGVLIGERNGVLVEVPAANDK